MVNKKTPTTCDNFVFDLGGKEVEHFHQISLPEASIPVVEHNSGSSKKRHPTKHAEQPDRGRHPGLKFEFGRILAGKRLAGPDQGRRIHHHQSAGSLEHPAYDR